MTLMATTCRSMWTSRSVLARIREASNLRADIALHGTGLVARRGTPADLVNAAR